jgi:hypothetical protein
MMAKLKAGALAVILVGVAAVVFWQQQQIKRLMVECAGPHDQLGQAASLRDENQRLAAQYKVSVEDSQADRRELMRLRAQSSRLRQLEQENAQLKVERQRLATQAQQAPASTEQQQRVPPSDAKAGAPPADVTDFGVLELSDRTPMRLELGTGKECVVTTTVLADGNLQTVFASESEIDGVLIQSKQTLTLTPGKQMAAIINGVEITLTPTLKTK